MMFSIISCAYWPSICLLSRNAYLNSYPILKLGCLFIVELQKIFIYSGYCSDYCTIALISHANKVMLKILQARLQHYVNHELPDVQAGFRKGRGTDIKLPTSAGSSKKQESSRKTSISAVLTLPKPLTVWITINWKILKEMGIPDHLTCLLRNLYAGQEATVRTGHGTRPVPNRKRSTSRLYIVTLLI